MQVPLVSYTSTYSLPILYSIVIRLNMIIAEVKTVWKTFGKISKSK